MFLPHPARVSPGIVKQEGGREQLLPLLPFPTAGRGWGATWHLKVPELWRGGSETGVADLGQQPCEHPQQHLHPPPLPLAQHAQVGLGGGLHRRRRRAALRIRTCGADRMWVSTRVFAGPGWVRGTLTLASICCSSERSMCDSGCWRDLVQETNAGTRPPKLSSTTSPAESHTNWNTNRST